MLRIPSSPIKVYSSTSTASAESVNTFPINDFHNIVAKFVATTITGTNPELNVYIQTSDDGGTTFYDVCKMAHVGTGTLYTNAGAHWAVIPVDAGDGKHIGTATKKGIAAGAGSVNGLPFIGRVYNIQASMSGTVTKVDYKVELYAQSVEPK